MDMPWTPTNEDHGWSLMAVVFGDPAFELTDHTVVEEWPPEERDAQVQQVTFDVNVVMDRLLLRCEPAPF